jgi:hypothetical protein
MDPDVMVQAHSTDRLYALAFLFAMVVLVVFVAWRALRYSRRIEAERAAQAKQRNDLAASRDPRPDPKREKNECRHCSSRATVQQPRYVFDPPITWWERLLGRGGETYVRTGFDSDFPCVLCPACASITASAMRSALAAREAIEADTHATTVRELTTTQDVDLPTAVHEATERLRAVQASFSRTGAPPRAPSKSVVPPDAAAPAAAPVAGTQAA